MANFAQSRRLLGLIFFLSLQDSSWSERSNANIGGRLTLSPKMNGNSAFVRKKGEQFAITCRFEAYTDDAAGAFEWLDPSGAVISGDEKASVRVQRLGTELLLLFNGVEKADAGTYRCRLPVAGSKLYMDAPLVVIQPAQWLETTTSVGGMRGERVFVNCGASGDPRPAVTITNGYNQLFRDGRFAVADDRLTIDPVQEADEGMSVLCTAAQAFSDQGITNVQTRKVRISVWLAPEMERSKLEYYGILGRNGSLSCGVRRAVPPVRDWAFFFKGRMLPDSSPKYRIVPATNATSATLHVFNVRMSDFGDYKCVGSNGKSSGEIYIQFSEALAPGPVQVVYVESSSSGVVWRVLESGERGELPVTALKILVLPREELDRVKDPQARADLWLYQARKYSLRKGGPESKYSVGGLDSGRDYRFQFSAVNEAGWGEAFEVGAKTLKAAASMHALSSTLLLISLLYFGSS